MQDAKELPADRDTPPLEGWVVIYRSRGLNTPRLQLAADRHTAETVADMLLDANADEIIAVCAAQDLYRLSRQHQPEAQP